MAPFVSHHWSHATLQKNIVLVRKITQCNWFEPRKIMGLRSVNIQFSKWKIFYKPTKDSNKKLGRRYSVHEQTYRWRRRIKTMEMCPQWRTGVGTNRDRWTWLVTGAPNGNFRENICSEDDLRSRIFGAFVVKFLACLPLIGYSKIYKMV